MPLLALFISGSGNTYLWLLIYVFHYDYYYYFLWSAELASAQLALRVRGGSTEESPSVTIFTGSQSVCFTESVKQPKFMLITFRNRENPFLWVSGVEVCVETGGRPGDTTDAFQSREPGRGKKLSHCHWIWETYDMNISTENQGICQERGKVATGLEACLMQSQNKACQQCRGEYYLDLKTFSSSRSCAEIPVLTHMCRKRPG